MNPKITVIIPLYNKAELVCRCLESVNKQTVLPFELVLVNDGSIDDSLQLATSYLEKTKINYSVLSQENKGVSAARNKGIEAAGTEYIAFLDADDEWEPQFIDKATQLIIDYPDAGLWGFAHDVFNENTGLRHVVNQDLTDYRGYLADFFKVSLRNEVVNSSKVVVKKSEMLKFSAFPVGIKVCEDIFVWILLALNNKVAYEDYIAVTINQVTDTSRACRPGEVPYPIEYFSQGSRFQCLPHNAKKYLWRVHVFHILGSCINANKKEALKRLSCGKKLFLWKNYTLYLLLLLPRIFFVALRKIKHKKSMV